MLRVLGRRQVLRSTANPEKVPWVCCTGMSLGVDASAAVPPFFPVGRGEDILFGGMLTACLGARAAYCNYAMWHTPERRADLPRDLRAIAFPDPADFVYIVLCGSGSPSLPDFGLLLKSLEANPGWTDGFIGDWRERTADVFRERAAGLPEFVLQESERVQESLRAAGPYRARLGDIGRYGDLIAAWPRLSEAARTYGE